MANRKNKNKGQAQGQDKVATSLDEALQASE